MATEEEAMSGRRDGLDRRAVDRDHTVAANSAPDRDETRGGVHGQTLRIRALRPGSERGIWGTVEEEDCAKSPEQMT